MLPTIRNMLARSGRIMVGSLLCGLILLTALPLHAAEPKETVARRVTTGLEVLYDFASSDDGRIRDMAGNDAQLDLQITDRSAVRQRSDGLQIIASTVMRTNKPPKRLIDAIEASSEITIEAWVRPAKIDQSGPARIVTFSRDTNQRNFTLGQVGNAVEVRLRTSKTNANGIPAVRSKSKNLATEPSHLVYSRNRDGQSRIYINGLLNAQDKRPGVLAMWDGGGHLALANELSGDRPWLGTFYLVAIYRRALSSSEVEQNFRASFQFDDGAQRKASGSDGCSHEWWHAFDEKKKNEQLRAHAHMKMREVAYFLSRLADKDSVEANGRTILENSLITISTESGDGRHNDVKRELSGIFHAISGGNGRFKTGQILDVNAEAIDVYNTMLTAYDVTRKLGPASRKRTQIDAIRA